jgi:hypothetical protein
MPRISQVRGIFYLLPWSAVVPALLDGFVHLVGGQQDGGFGLHRAARPDDQGSRGGVDIIYIDGFLALQPNRLYDFLISGG